MPKKLIIGISVAVIVVSVVAFAILLIRQRALAPAPGDAALPFETVSDVRPDGQPLGDIGGSTETKDPVGFCGDGVCQTGESAWCKNDCGSEEERFRGSVGVGIISPTSAVAMWRTDTNSTGEVSYGLTESYELGQVATDEPSTEHQLLLENLLPGSNYFMQLKVTKEDGSTYEVDAFNFEIPAALP